MISLHPTHETVVYYHSSRLVIGEINPALVQLEDTFWLSPCFLPLSQSDSAGELRAWIFKEFPAKTACCVPFPAQDDWDDVTSCNGNVGRALTRDPHRVLFQCVGIFSHYTENNSLLFFFVPNSRLNVHSFLIFIEVFIDWQHDISLRYIT